MDIGVVHYVIRPEGGVIDAVYYTTRLDENRPGTGVATGDTSNGFPGTYDITYYYPNGEAAIDLELVIQRNGEVYEFKYLQNGRLLLTGVGIETPSGLSGGYRRVAEV